MRRYEIVEYTHEDIDDLTDISENSPVLCRRRDESHLCFL